MLLVGQGIIYVPVRRSFAPTERVGYRVLPATRAATILHRGTYAGLGRVRRALTQWSKAAGLNPAGDLRILYLQFGAEPRLRVPRPWLVERTEDFLTELQLPVDQDSADPRSIDRLGRDRARG
jgi:hypothetical protein